jgi:hypothetical protein
LGENNRLVRKLKMKKLGNVVFIRGFEKLPHSLAWWRMPGILTICKAETEALELEASL